MTQGPGGPWEPGPDGARPADPPAGAGQQPAAEPAPWTVAAQPGHEQRAQQQPAQAAWGLQPDPAPEPSATEASWVATDPAEPAPTEERRRKGPPWRRIATAGVALLLLGLLLVGVGIGWTARTLTASPADTESPVQVVEAPSGGDADVVVLPDVRGLETVVAQQAISDAGLGASAVTVLETPSAQPVGTVVGQDPVGGTSGATAVTVYVAVTGTVPALVGTDGSAAIQTLVELGVNPAVTEVYDPATPEGTVLALDPPAGSPLAEDMTVTVAGPAGSLYLDELDAQNGCSTGEANVNGTAYAHSLYCSASTTARSTTYLLNRRSVQLTGSLGIQDTSDNDYVGAVVIRGDGAVLFSAQLRYGTAVPFSVPTTGVLQLEIEYSQVDPGDSYPSGYVVVADPRVVGSPADIDVLANQ